MYVSSLLAILLLAIKITANYGFIDSYDPVIAIARRAFRDDALLMMLFIYPSLDYLLFLSFVTTLLVDVICRLEYSLLYTLTPSLSLVTIL